MFVEFIHVATLAAVVCFMRTMKLGNARLGTLLT